MALRIVFFGTPAFAVPSLERLLASTHTVVGVVTQPDRPRGRGHRVVAGAVKAAALRRGLPVLQPERVRDPAWLETVAALQADLGVVAAYGRILPAALLDLPRLGFINVHASLLPRWRGAAPVHRAILAGDTVTGVTIMRVVPALDAGPMLAGRDTPIGPDETSEALEARLSIMGAEVLGDVTDELDAGSVAAQDQDEREVTYAPRLERRESRIDWARPARAVHNQIRGLQPWPLAGAMLNGRRVSLLKSEPVEIEGEPGTVVAVMRTSFDVAASPGGVRILALQEAGRAPMSTSAYLNGRPVRMHDRLEPLPDAGFQSPGSNPGFEPGD
jgi:methionyl-tRNA formyltransferase